ncbi:MAG: ComEC/Rec2 family competence protein [Candidatus Acetothermia bacterium]
MKRRPLVLAFLALSFGLSLAPHFGVEKLPRTLFPSILAIVTPMALLLGKRKEMATLLTLIILMTTGLLLYSNSHFRADRLYPALRDISSARGEIASYPRKKDSGLEFELCPDKYPGKLRVYVDGGNTDQLDYGHKLRVKGYFNSPSNYGDSGYRQYLQRRRIWGLVDADSINIMEEESESPLLKKGWRLRSLIFNRLDVLLPEEGNFLKAVMFGDRHSLPEKTWSSFEKTGLAHLLAASGLHLGIFIGIYWKAAGIGGFRSSVAYLFSLLLLGFYLPVVGYKTSLVRASLIYLFWAGGRVLRDRGLILKSWHDSYQALAAAGLVIVILNPTSFYEIGFRLSFAGAFSLITFSQPIEEALPRLIPGPMRRLLSASISAHLGVAPLILANFGRLHPWAIFTNLLAIPLMALILYGGVLMLAIGGIPGVSWICALESKAIGLYKGLIGVLASWPGSSVPAGGVLPKVWPVVYFLAILILYSGWTSKVQEKRF